MIGADTQKDTHRLAAVDAATGHVLTTKTASGKRDGLLAPRRSAHGLGREQVWAIDDWRHVSGRLERYLNGQGELVRAPPTLTGESRRGKRRPGRCYDIDAVTVARAALREGGRCHRDRLGLDRDSWLQRLVWRLAAMVQTARVLVARDELRRICEMSAERSRERQLAALIRPYAPQLVAEQDCATLTAATLIGYTAGAGRLLTDGHFVRRTDSPPVPLSSGRPDRVGLNRGSDRQLRYGLHRIAVTGARTCPKNTARLARKLAEGQEQARGLPLPQTPPHPPLLATLSHQHTAQLAQDGYAPMRLPRSPA